VTLSSTPTPATTYDRTGLPAPGTWTIDPGHADVGFLGRHLMFTKVRGRFTGVTGSVVIAEDPRESSVHVEIDMASVSSGSKDRDDHLKSADLFDVARYPTATFRSTEVWWTEGPQAEVQGDLTIHGVTRPVVLDVEFSGAITDPWGGERAVFSASTEIDREDWDLTWNMALETGGILVSKRIRIEIDVETVRQP
jgi:polyisoprenoid-binding protein YceI